VGGWFRNRFSGRGGQALEVYVQEVADGGVSLDARVVVPPSLVVLAQSLGRLVFPGETSPS